jgi:hypothetical protein
MKNEHIPFELIDEIHHWVEKNISTNEEEYSHKREKRLAIIHQTINNLKELSCDTPKDLIDEKKALEELLSTPNENKQIMLEIVEKLHALMKYIKQNISNKRNKHNKVQKAPPKVLCVTLETGEIINENTAVNTFLKTLEYIGLEKIADFSDIQLQGHPVVSRTKNLNGRKLKKVSDFFIEVHCGTNKKADILRRYAKMLGLHIQVAVKD